MSMTIRGRLRVEAGRIRRMGTVIAQRPRVGVYRWLDANPYQSLMYSRFGADLRVSALRQIYELKAFAALPAAHRLLHLHWETSYLWGPSGRWRDQRYSDLRGILEGWSGRGGRIAWTVHDANFFPPEEAERMAALCDMLADTSDLVHVHSQAARDHVVADLGVAPEKVVVVEHPSYVTLYPEVSRGEPSPHAGGRRLLLFGMIKGYKNYLGLAAALEQLPRGAFSSVVFAGSGRPDLVPIDRFRAVLPATLDARHIPESEVPGLFAAADFLVLPYSLSLTSGAALLSIGFGVPVIAPRLGGIPETLPPENAPLLYDPEDPEGLMRALERAAALSEDAYAAMRRACLDLAAELHPHRQSDKLKLALTERGLLPK
jgi:beta-1,4-mannosyltransferase